MKERPWIYRKSFNMPGGRSLSVGCLVLSFIFSVQGHEWAGIYQPGFQGASGRILTRDPAWISLGGPVLGSASKGAYAGAYVERCFNLKELQLWGLAIAYSRASSSLGLGYVNSFYDGRGSQRLGLSTSLKVHSVLLGVQLNAIQYRWSHEAPGNRLLFSRIALAVPLKPGLMLGCMAQSAESLLRPSHSVPENHPLLVCELRWQPDDKTEFVLLLGKDPVRGVSWEVDINLGTGSGWQVGAGSCSGRSLYHLYLRIPVRGLKLNLAFDHHRFLGSSPFVAVSGPLRVNTSSPHE